MATGMVAFSGNTSGVVIDAILNRAPLPPTQLNPAVPPKLEEVINKAVEKDHKLRCQSAAELRSDRSASSATWDSSRITRSSPPRRPGRRRRNRRFCGRQASSSPP